MSNMVSYIVTAPTESAGIDGGTQFNPAALHTFDRMKVLLEQAIYARYLLRVASSTHTVTDVIKNIRMLANNLPSKLSYSELALQPLYESGLRLIKDVLENATSLKSPQDIFTIFNQPLIATYINREYVPTITEPFLVSFLSAFYGWYNTEKYPNQVLQDAYLLIPSMTVLKNYDPLKATSQHNDYVVVINLSPRAFGEFTLGKKAHGLSDFVSCSNMYSQTVDSLIAIYAAFSIDHDQYVMTNAEGRKGYSMADVCFDLVTGSSFVHPDSAGLIRVYDSNVFFETTKQQIAAGRLRMVEDCELFGELLARTGASPDLVNYFTKPISLISAAEAFAFRNSELVTFMNDKFMAGVAAIDESTDPDIGTGTDTTETDPDGTDTPVDESDPSSLDSGISEEPSSAEADKPQIDPKMMLLELVKPSEPMSDFIYREMVSRRIGAILKNPPENAMPNDLLMLKRWRSRWIYLASVDCLRDFLTRVSIRLSDV